MSDRKIIRLTRDQNYLLYQRQLQDFGLLPMGLPAEDMVEYSISIGGSDKISRRMVVELFHAGWRGLEQIPADCVVD
jgi:hypothetical protein